MKLTIDGKKIEAEGKKSILDVARENDINIPALCDHPILGPFSGCRLCIVEIQGRRGFAPSCSTYAEDGMEVKSDTPQLRKTRKEILGLILTEHPDACLICTEKQSCDEFKSTIRKVGEVTGCVLCSNNGRCDLQDVVEAVQIDKVDFPSVYRDLEVKKNDPFFDRNYNLCILCGRCVRVCHELRGASTVHFVDRGPEAVIGTALDRTLHESGCQFCGACVDVCPTGALTERAVKYEPLPDGTAKILCPLCGMGCELDVMLSNGRMLSAKPAEKGTVNQGQACVKGRFLIKDVVISPRRILQPMIRRRKELEEVSWEEALDFVAQKIKTYKGNEIGFITSPQLSCEDNVVAEKFAQEVVKTRNVGMSTGFTPLDSLWHLEQKNGISPSFHFNKEDIARAKVIFLTGTDLALSHPMLWLEVLKAVRNGARLLVASPFEIAGSRYASSWLPIKPGSEDLLYRCLSKMILKEGEVGGHDLEGYESFRRSLEKLNLSEAAEVTGIDEKSLRRATEMLMRGKPYFIAGMGLTPSSGENKNIASLWNLSLLCKGKLIPLGLENNQRCIFEMQRNNSRKTKLLSQILQAVREGQIKALYTIGPIPLDKKIKTELLIVQDSYLSGIAERADVVLPATTFAETDGTFVNVEGRTQSYSRVIQPIGESKPDWWILSQLAKKRGKKNFAYKKSQDILKEMKKRIPSLKKPSSAHTKRGKQKFVPLRARYHGTKIGKKFPFILSSDYSLDTYRNLVLSSEIKGFEMVRNARWIMINPEDAKTLKLEEGEGIIMESSVGKKKGVAKITEAVPQGTVRASFLWIEGTEEAFNPLPVRIKRGK
ncbi:MAG: molybdopterin-dependent oxidoreductase [Candidatus Aminicenantes bacterium]|nr:MAG: molybdopterin-dependent oxidoreductase [Candidatus Aminicenantes bacterium]